MAVHRVPDWVGESQWMEGLGSAEHFLATGALEGAEPAAPHLRRSHEMRQDSKGYTARRPLLGSTRGGSNARQGRTPTPHANGPGQDSSFPKGGPLTGGGGGALACRRSGHWLRVFSKRPTCEHFLTRASC